MKHWVLIVTAVIAAGAVLEPAIHAGMDTSAASLAHIAIAAIVAAASSTAAYFTNPGKP